MASFSDALTQEADLLLDEFGVEGDEQPYGRLENTRIDDDLIREANRYLDEVGVEVEPQTTLPSRTPEQPDLTEQDEQAAIPRPTDLETMENLAATGGETGVKEQLLMGLINEDPELQVLYLRKQGFNTRIGPNGQAEYEQAEGDWRPALEGITQYWPNIVEGVVGALATGAKAVGAVGAPATGGASIAAAAGLGAAAGGVLEGAKQGAAYAAGLREEADPGRVLEKSAVMGVGAGAGEALGRAVGAGARGLKRAFVGRARDVEKLASKEQVKAAAKALEVEPTAGMLTGDPVLRKIESALDSLDLSAGGALTRAKTRNIRAAIDEVAEELVKNRSLKSPREVGEAFSEQVKKSIADKLEPAEVLYGEINDKLGQVKIDRKSTKKLFNDLFETAQWSPQGEELRLVEKVYQLLNKADNVEQLKLIRSKLAKSVNRDASQGIREAYDGLYDALTKVREDSFQAAVNSAKGTEDYAELYSKLKEADSIWKDVSNQVKSALVKRGTKTKFGPKAQAAKELDVAPEKLMDKFLSGKDSQKAEALKKLSPEAFRELATARIAKMAETATSKAQGNQGRLLFSSLSREIDKLSPEVAKEIFGKNAIQKQKAAAILLRNLPKDINPSGTAKTQNLLNLLTQNIQGIYLSTAGLIIRGARPFNTPFGRNLLKGLSKAGLITGASVGPKGLMKAVEQDADNKRNQK